MGRYGVLFITSGDIIRGFGEGIPQSSAGGIWVLDITQERIKDPVKLNILGALRVSHSVSMD